LRRTIARILAASSAILVATAGVADEESGSKPAAEIHGINPADMDPSVSACRDLNLYANGGWIKNNPVPPDRSVWSPGGQLYEKTQEKLRGILEKVSKAPNAPGSDDQKIGDFYSTCMDEAAVEAQGAAPLKGEFDAIDRVASLVDLQAEIARLQLLNVNAVFGFESDQDRRNASEVIAGAYQGGLSLPDRDYYLKTDEDSKKLRDQYVAHVTKMFALLGDDSSKASANARSVLSLETRLAQASMTPVEQRDPDKTYNRKSLPEMAKLTPNFSWTSFLRQIGAPPLAAINVGQPAFFEAVNRELVSTPLPV